MAVNGDEGEPHIQRPLLSGTHTAFVPRGYVDRCMGVEAEKAFIYMRDEYPAVLHILRTEIAALEQAGLVAPGYIDLRRGAGAYICGEESAMIESIEGKRGLPRHRPRLLHRSAFLDAQHWCITSKRCIGWRGFVAKAPKS